MHPRTRATLAELEQADWFHAVGKPIDGPVIVVSSWYEAMTYCESDLWEQILQEAANGHSQRVLSASIDRFRQWNVIAGQMRQVVVPLVERKTRKVIEEYRLPSIFKSTVEWDIGGVYLEAEYADITPPGFFAGQSYWYAHGHFPCGWDGEYPKGKLVVY
jgi:hypothetical protein